MSQSAGKKRLPSMYDKSIIQANLNDTNLRYFIIYAPHRLGVCGMICKSGLTNKDIFKDGR